MLKHYAIVNGDVIAIVNRILIDYRNEGYGEKTKSLKIPNPGIIKFTENAIAVNTQQPVVLLHYEFYC